MGVPLAFGEGGDFYCARLNLLDLKEGFPNVWRLLN